MFLALAACDSPTGEGPVTRLALLAIAVAFLCFVVIAPLLVVLSSNTQPEPGWPLAIMPNFGSLLSVAYSSGSTSSMMCVSPVLSVPVRTDGSGMILYVTWSR